MKEYGQQGSGVAVAVAAGVIIIIIIIIVVVVVVVVEGRGRGGPCWDTIKGRAKARGNVESLRLPRLLWQLLKLKRGRWGPPRWNCPSRECYWGAGEVLASLWVAAQSRERGKDSP